MPELIEQSTPPPVPPIPDIPNNPDIPGTPALHASSDHEQPEVSPEIAFPPLIDPDRWEDFAVYRETFLVYFTELRDNTALRDSGRLVHNMALEYYQHWPDQPEGWTRSHLRAAVADLRHLEGFLATMGENPPEHHPHEAHLCRMADRMARKVASVADQIEKELGSWRGEAS
jgi:hypothetical protein